MNRRELLKISGLTAAATAGLAGCARTTVRQDFTARPPFPGARATVVTGQVTSQGRPLAGVPISDGINTIVSGEDGTFRFLTTPGQPFIFVTIPAGHRIPLNEGKRTARFYVPLLPEKPERIVFWDFEPLPSPDINHTFFVWADPQTQDAREMQRLKSETAPDLSALVRSMGDARHCFGVTCGDLMFDDLTLLPEYEAAIAAAGGIPFFQVVGNHDLDMDSPTDENSAVTFREFFGPTFYSFNRGRAHHVALDDVMWLGGGYCGYLNQQQLDWLAKDLAHVEPGALVIVHLHIPTWTDFHRRQGLDEPDPRNIVLNREALYELLAPFKAHLIGGHLHEHEHIFHDNGIVEHNLGAVCGAWWTGDLCTDGTPNGYGVFEVEGDELKWRYKATGRPLEERMSVHARGTLPEHPEDVAANIWDWDEECKALLHEDGRPPVEMRPVPEPTRDPAARALLARERLPDNRQWATANPTRHLVTAPVRADHGPLRVEFIDRFGRRAESRLHG